MGNHIYLLVAYVSHIIMVFFSNTVCFLWVQSGQVFAVTRGYTSEYSRYAETEIGNIFVTNGITDVITQCVTQIINDNSVNYS